MNKFLKWAGIIVGGLVGLLLVSLLILYGMGQARLNKTYDVPVTMVEISNDEESLAEGKRIFQYRGCEACHGEDLQGLVYLDNPAIGQVITPNLTTGKGGIGSQRTDEDLIRAIKHGIRYDGTPLLFMPSTEFYYLSDADLGKVLAYIRSKPPVDNEVQSSKLSTTGFIVMNIAKTITFLPAELIPHDQTPPPAPEPGVTAEYGGYLSLSCRVCHGQTYSGGAIPGFPAEWPAAPNLTSGAGSRLPGWGEGGFIEIMRTGEHHGRKINPSYMPWKSYRHMNDDELKAVYTYLMSLPPKDFGNR
ncbi:Fructose dehydrogenase cytochrome subunit [Anaerolineales bacterium]|nr:Fructose dehydrogenase cytochrome subunit [Anaerolineales bacterium]